MSAELQEPIFEPFYTTRGESGGTGLGLAVAHGIMEGFSGAIHLYSEEGQGTTFNLYIPSVAVAVEKGSMVEEQRPARGEERILLVDDDEVIMQLGTKILERLGYRVTGVLGGERAMEVFRNAPGEFDLLVTDMNMPRVNGPSLIRMVRSLRAEIPVVLTTGFTHRLPEELIKGLGINEVLAKPMTALQMSKAVRSALDGAD